MISGRRSETRVPAQSGEFSAWMLQDEAHCGQRERALEWGGDRGGGILAAWGDGDGGIRPGRALRNLSMT